ncbi:hypothetical protein SM0020_33923 [Sinorhizobium meliloti CCNWSX0020]|uniref:Uncharacterized protein n=1 Tax=Sinorhizobium meliloti CCNWSX0020 TaxID=1107881 RepID=H0GB72_RHIML|nr:hypothetical protein SM0020_33923 [Sinorhizobium meliloti CCNWSX0020]
MLQEFSNRFCASARFIPKRFVDLVRKWSLNAEAPPITSTA